MNTLAAPFDPALIEFRAGATFVDKQGELKALALAYAESRTYMDRLDAVFGLAWSSEVEAIDSKTVKCTLTIHSENIQRAALAEDTDLMSAESRAFKRACAQLGIGRYLYNLESHWVPAVKKGKNVIITEATQDWLRQKLQAAPQRPQPTKPSQRTNGNGNGAQTAASATYADDGKGHTFEPEEDNPFDDTLRPDEIDLIESWTDHYDAMRWAVKVDACANEHEAQGSLKKIVKRDFGDSLTERNTPSVLIQYYKRQREKLAASQQPDSKIQEVAA